MMGKSQADQMVAFLKRLRYHVANGCPLELGMRSSRDKAGNVYLHEPRTLAKMKFPCSEFLVPTPRIETGDDLRGQFDNMEIFLLYHFCSWHFKRSGHS